MYKIRIYCLSKVHLGVLNVSLCIYRVAHLAFFAAIWLFLRVDLVFFACDYLATLRGTRLFLMQGLQCVQVFWWLELHSERKPRHSLLGVA